MCRVCKPFLSHIDTGWKWLISAEVFPWTRDAAWIEPGAIFLWRQSLTIVPWARPLPSTPRLCQSSPCTYTQVWVTGSSLIIPRIHFWWGSIIIGLYPSLLLHRLWRVPATQPFPLHHKVLQSCSGHNPTDWRSKETWECHRGCLL